MDITLTAAELTLIQQWQQEARVGRTRLQCAA